MSIKYVYFWIYEINHEIYLEYINMIITVNNQFKYSYILYYKEFHNN